MEVMTIYGPMDDSQLQKKAWVEKDAQKATQVVEYYLAGVMVHRSAHVVLKQGLGIESLLGAV